MAVIDFAEKIFKNLKTCKNSFFFKTVPGNFKIFTHVNYYSMYCTYL